MSFRSKNNQKPIPEFLPIGSFTGPGIPGLLPDVPFPFLQSLPFVASHFIALLVDANKNHELEKYSHLDAPAQHKLVLKVIGQYCWVLAGAG